VAEVVVAEAADAAVVAADPAAAVDAADRVAAVVVAVEIVAAIAAAMSQASNHPSFAFIGAPRSSKAAVLSASVRW
jgi:hypothetical protein